MLLVVGILAPTSVFGCNALVGLRDIEEVTAAEAGTSPDASAEAAVASDTGSGSDTSLDAPVDSPSDVQPDVVEAGCAVIPGLVAWWRGEGNANEEVNGFNGAWTDGTATYAAGKSGQAFSLNAAAGGGFVSVPHAAALSLVIPFTISVWINAPGDSFRVVDKLTNGVNDGYLLDLNTTRQPRFISGAAYMQAPAGLAADTWHHVVAVAASTTSRKIYVDGVVAGELTTALAGPSAPTVPLRFGANSDSTSRFPGLVDEVALFDRALTSAEVASIYSRGSESLCR